MVGGGGVGGEHRKGELTIPLRGDHLVETEIDSRAVLERR